MILRGISIGQIPDFIIKKLHSLSLMIQFMLLLHQIIILVFFKSNLNIFIKYRILQVLLTHILWYPFVLVLSFSSHNLFIIFGVKHEQTCRQYNFSNSYVYL